MITASMMKASSHQTKTIQVLRIMSTILCETALTVLNFIFLFTFLIFFETGFLCVALAVLENSLCRPGWPRI